MDKPKPQEITEITLYDLREEVIRAMGKMADLMESFNRLCEAVKSMEPDKIQRIDESIQRSRAIQAKYKKE